MARLAVLTYDLAGALELTRETLVRVHDLVERVGDFAGETRLVTQQPNREIPVADRLQGPQQLANVQLARIQVGAVTPVRRGTILVHVRCDRNFRTQDFRINEVALKAYIKQVHDVCADLGWGDRAHAG